MLLVHVAAFILSLISLATAFAPQTSSLLRSLHPIATRDLPIGTCNSDTPCVNGACCGTVIGPQFQRFSCQTNVLRLRTGFVDIRLQNVARETVHRIVMRKRNVVNTEPQGLRIVLSTSAARSLGRLSRLSNTIK